MGEIMVTVSIPGGEYCRDERRCIFTKYSRHHSGYNCALYGKLLRGGDNPRKCAACLEYCRQREGEAEK